MTQSKGLDSSFFSNNRQKLVAKFPKAPIIITANGLLQKTRDDDAFPFKQSANFWYLTGLNEPDVILLIHKGLEYLILPKKDKHHEIFTGGFNIDEIKNTTGIHNILDSHEGWQLLSPLVKKSKQIGAITAGPEYVKIYNVYTNPATRRLNRRLKALNKNLILIDLQPHISSLRAIKTTPEIDMIQHCVDHTGKLLAEISRNFKNYKNEQEIEAEVIYYAAKNGFEQAFHPIIANGINACTLHYHANNAVIDHKLPTLLDIGLSKNGYCSDITRVFRSLSTDSQKDIYQDVVKVSKFAVSLLKPGVMPGEYEKKVALFAGEILIKRGLIKDLEPKSIYKYFRHRTSHYLGIDVHDVGDYSKPFEVGNVITVEPGIYIDEENTGIRIEDDVLIVADGAKILSKNLSRDLDSIRIKS